MDIHTQLCEMYGESCIDIKKKGNSAKNIGKVTWKYMVKKI